MPRLRGPNPRRLLRPSLPLHLFLLFSLLCHNGGGYAASHPVGTKSSMTAEELQVRLDELKSEIGHFTQLQQQTRTERTVIEDELKKNETAIGDLLRKIKSIEDDLAISGHKITVLQKQERELKLGMEKQQGYIGQQIRAAFKIGRQEYFKVLLNQGDPGQISRMLTYYDYLNRARAEQVQSYTETIASLQQVAQRIRVETGILNQGKIQLETRHVDLRTNRKEREVTLARLNTRIVDQGAKIRKLSSDRGHLEELLQSISRSIANLPTPASIVPFAKLKGQMLLPVKGKIVNRFGSQSTGRLRWSGLFISTNAGAPVHAIHYGRIVFSEWLRGFGLLVIIDHGDGFMSLYGHNQAIYRETGEWVNPGDVIANTGNSGGLERTGLYFEIRVSGKPIDPQLWCLARG